MTTVTVKAELVNYFTKNRFDWTFKTKDNFEHICKLHDGVSKTNPTSHVNFTWGGKKDMPNFIAGVPESMTIDEEKVHNEEMTWKEFDKIWHPNGI